jgi:hypothetical protein
MQLLIPLILCVANVPVVQTDEEAVVIIAIVVEVEVEVEAVDMIVGMTVDDLHLEGVPTRNVRLLDILLPTGNIPLCHLDVMIRMLRETELRGRTIGDLALDIMTEEGRRLRTIGASDENFLLFC